MDTIKKTKLLIIGSGPAGSTAAIYAARANLQPIMICGNETGGQLMTTTEVENFPGFATAIQGPALMDAMIEQAKNVGCEVIYDYVKKVDFSEKPFRVYASNQTFETQSVVIATGAQAKWLGLESEKYFSGFGVSGCAVCDGFFFRNETVLVVGGGNTAVEEAIYMTKHAKKVYLIHRRDKLRAEQVLQQRLFKHEKIEVIWNHVLEEVLGEREPQKKVTGGRIKNVLTNETKIIQASGIFIAIGHKPTTEIFKEYLDIDSEGYIKTSTDSTKTNIEGIFAAGDVQDKIFRQAVTAAGTGCMAALEAEKYLSE